MKTTKSDLWMSGAEAICITTNLVIKRDGNLVMGAGVAKQAAERYPELPAFFADAVRAQSPVCAYKGTDHYLIALPTKRDWKQDSDLNLILGSLKLVVKLVDSLKLKSVALTPPGCGNGNLKWDDVRKAIEPLLDDRFTVYGV